VDSLYSAAKRQFELEYLLLSQSRERAQTEASEADAALRAAALTAFRETGELKPMPGVEIKMMPRPLEYEPDEAYSWALSHRLALKLDVAAFEKFAKAGAPYDFRFVTIREKEPTPHIARDLGPVLDEMKED
jgi:hypothetical protein